MKINTTKLMFNITLIIIFIVPSYEFDKINIPIKQIMFSLSIIIYLLNFFYNNGKIYLKDLPVFLIFLLFTIMTMSVNYFHLLGLFVLKNIIKDFNNKKIDLFDLVSKPVFYLSFISIIFYSFIYGTALRPLAVGIKEINQTGFVLFLLFSIVRHYNKKIGNGLLFVGLLTFSRNYFLALIIMLILERRLVVRYLKNNKLKFINIYTMSAASIIILISLSTFFSQLYSQGLLLSTSYKGVDRFKVQSLFDFSNYHRFTINTKVLSIMNMNKDLLFTGIDTGKFYELSYINSLIKGIPFHRLKPHNYFFSYLQIYGIWSIFIIKYTLNIMDSITTNKNISILVPIFIYISILGIGINSYWLFYSALALLVTRK